MLSEVYDIECLSNCFTYTGYCRQTQTYHQFVIHKLRNDYDELIKHLFRDKLIMIGYNNLSYDYPMLHHIINHYDEYKHLAPVAIAQNIYNKSQNIIDEKFSVVADKNTKIMQIDLFTLWHFDNLAKSTSLKALEIAMNLDKVEDMPFDHRYWVKDESEIEQILSYNKHDVFATNKFLDITLGKTENPLYKGKNKLDLRKSIANTFKLPCLSWNDIKIGTELILNLYCSEFGLNPYLVRKLRTEREEIKLSECIPTWCNFESKEFKRIQKIFSDTVIYNGNTKNALSCSAIFQNFKFDYGTGGAHGCIKPGVYSEDDNWMILDLDIDGMYPSLAITQGIFPEHLGKEFIDIYDGKIVSIRLAEKKKPKSERDFVIVEGYKLAANGTYGKSNSNDSYLYDPLYTMKTTISGQILISMWAEYLVKASPDLQILQVNTDGISIRLKREDYDKVITATEELMKVTNMSYEANIYEKMVIVDVNNYIAKYKSGDCKYKGLFEIDKELHKDPSMRIVPIALSNYFLNDVPIGETIKNHTNIYDFCLRLKINSSCTGKYKYIEDFEIKYKNLSKNTRYFISNNGGILEKHFNDGRISGVNIGFSTTLFNNYYEVPMEDYNINYDFYIKECKKIISQIEDAQMSLF